VKTPKARRDARLSLLARAPRQLPVTFALVGVQKAATSTLYWMLVAHDQVAASPEKEMRFFSDETQDWTKPDYSTYVRPVVRPQVAIAGDADPDLFWWPEATARMRAYNPEMKLILSVRDPVERALSQWSMQRDRDERFPDIPRAIDALMSDALPAAPPPGMPPWKFRRRGVFTRGLYGQQLARGLQFFDRNAWLIMDFRSIVKDSQATLDLVTDHLGLDRFATYPSPQHRNITRSDHRSHVPSAAQMQRLVDVYAQDAEEFARLSGMSVNHWPTVQTARGELSLEEFTHRVIGKVALPR
jgi:hypothetical protein